MPYREMPFRAFEDEQECSLCQGAEPCGRILCAMIRAAASSGPRQIAYVCPDVLRELRSELISRTIGAGTYSSVEILKEHKPTDMQGSFMGIPIYLDPDEPSWRIEAKP